MNPIKLMTVTLWAVSKNRLPPSITLSSLDTEDAFARRWAALNRATFCSGVSMKPAAALATPPLATFGKGPLELGEANRDSAALELACGVVGVNRVASETLRGVEFIGIGRYFRLVEIIRGVNKLIEDSWTFKIGFVWVVQGMLGRGG